MATDFKFRGSAVAKLTKEVGVYVLCDLDGVPLYVGQSADGIQSRVRRHLTSARSDIIANRQIDIWEVAYVWSYPVSSLDEITPLEACIFHHFNARSQLINGSVPVFLSQYVTVLPEPSQKIQVMTDDEISYRKQSQNRLPRQAKHYADIVGHFLEVKESPEIARAMAAHFQRLARYHGDLLKLGEEAPSDISNP